MSDKYIFLMVLVMSLVTALLRFLPFLIFGGKKKTPEYILWLGKYLPFAIMGMLVVYCLRNISFVQSPHGIPEIIACVLVAALHVWKRNSLISIAGGTVCYMLLVQFVF